MINSLQPASKCALTGKSTRYKLDLPTSPSTLDIDIDMYLPLSKFESIQRVSLTLRCNNNLL